MLPSASNPFSAIFDAEPTLTYNDWPSAAATTLRAQ
jgi:hypothetical protein